jgi:hypothetical protein
MYSLKLINETLKHRSGTMKQMTDLLMITPLVDIKVIEETLNRVGVANKKNKVLYPSCYLWKIDDVYYLMHFKQLFFLTRDSGYNNVSQADLSRRNAIAFCLKNWKLIDVSDDLIKEKDDFVFVLPFAEKPMWQIQHKFNIRSAQTHQVAA